MNGLDIQPFVNCVLSGPGITAGCDCADMNVDGAIEDIDVSQIVDRLLTKEPCP